MFKWNNKNSIWLSLGGNRRMIFFTSDLHLSHCKNFIYEARGFKTIEEMNEEIVKRWNQIVSKDDIVYNLGDVFLGTDIQTNLDILKQLNGHIHYAIGNHDGDKKIEAIKQLPNTADVQFGYRLKHKKTIFLCTHYPTVVGNMTFDNIWNLHGHTHQKDSFSNILYCYHVGVDSQNCYPVGVEQIFEDIKKEKEAYRNMSKQ